jgi:hypothetical protein
MNIPEHPPPKVCRRSRWQPAPADGLVDLAFPKYRFAAEKSIFAPPEVARVCPRRLQLLAIISDPSTSEDNREAAAHDLTLEFPEI